MAEALVAGSFLSALLQVLFDRLASRQLVDFVNGQKLSNRQLKRLETVLNSVNVVLDDAEEKQITKPAVKKWLDDLKHFVYEAEDILDEIGYEALRLELKVDSGKGKLQNFLYPFRSKMATKLEDTLDGFQHLVGQKDILGLLEGIGGKSLVQNRTTTSLLDGPDVYGRDGDKEAIMTLLLSDELKSNSVSVLPILGMAGVGKTTLARLVYNSRRVSWWFELKVWICVSEEFDVVKLSKDILEEVTGKTCSSVNLNQIQLQLKEQLKEQRVLLVLDDVWNNKFASDWQTLLRPFQCVAEGSTILVTTRDKSVPLLICSVPSLSLIPPHHLQILNDDDSWSLFAKHAFDHRTSNLRPDLIVIGRKIIRNCNGLPLALKTLGGLLRFEENAGKWSEISKSSMWDHPWSENILPALMLSYHHLPSHLKRCFAYCAIFPKGYRFKKQELIVLWMAEGYLLQSRGNRETREVGEIYFDNLVSRSFFQPSSGDSSWFVMHDLLNDLASFVSGNFCSRLEGGVFSNLVKETRHLSYTRMEDYFEEKFEAVFEANLLRTFLFVEGLEIHWSICIDNHVVEKLLLKLKRLRVLSLSHSKFLTKLPSSLGKLKHLRYLDLSWTSITRVPESVSRLYYLETLRFYQCSCLVELPTNIKWLINLCLLDIRGTILVKMPPHMSKLKRLLRLAYFVTGKERGCTLKELGELNHLSGALCIKNLEHVIDVHDAEKADLKSKVHLKELELRWESSREDSLDVIERLKPHSGIERVSIVGYGGFKLPDWSTDPSLSKVVSVKLIECNNCSFLPPLGQLSSLKELYIEACHGVEKVGAEFYESDGYSLKKRPFRSLKTMEFKRMGQLKEWNSYEKRDDDSGAFPVLEKLYIRDCPKLVKAVSNDLPSLFTFEIVGCPKLQVSSLELTTSNFNVLLEDDSRKLLMRQHHLQILWLVSQASPLDGLERVNAHVEGITIENCTSLRYFLLESFPNLKTLYIGSCPHLEQLYEPMATQGPFTCLYYLEISNCPSLVSFPEGGLPAPNLRSLIVHDCLKMKSLPEHMHSFLPSLTELYITTCPELGSFPDGGLPSKLEILDINGCDKLIASMLQGNWQAPCSLVEFHIGYGKDVETFPNQMLLPSTLTTLQILGLHNLKTMKCQALQCLTSITKLGIGNCDNLVPFSVGALFQRLESLDIYGCSKLIAGRLHWNLQLLPFLSHLGFGDNEDVESFPEETLLPSTLTSLAVCNLQNLKTLDYKGLQCLTSLRKLKIENCSKLQSLPEDGLPPTLRSLEIKDLPNFRSLDCNGFKNLYSLRLFKIYDCPHLQSMPNEGLPSSIASLSISGCPLLAQSCQRAKGRDWHKISHIPNIQINFQSIN